MTIEGFFYPLYFVQSRTQRSSLIRHTLILAISPWLEIINFGCISLILCSLPLVVLAVFPPIRKRVLPHPLSDAGIGPSEVSWAAKNSQFRLIGPFSCYCHLRTFQLEILCPPRNEKQNQIFCTHCIDFWVPVRDTSLTPLC